jgi:hypothetical protein
LTVAAESTRRRWTDERIDDLARRMDAGFAQVNERLDRVDGRIDALQRTMITVGGGMIASILVSAAGIAATQV